MMMKTTFTKITLQLLISFSDAAEEKYETKPDNFINEIILKDESFLFYLP
jgi:hypothetical protein